MSIIIVILFNFLVYCTAVRTLPSRDLGNLFVKHAQNELLDYEYKIIEDVLRLYSHVWDSVRTVTKAFRCFVCRSAFSALFVLIKIGAPDETIVNTGTKLCSVAISTRVCHGVIKLNLPILKYIIKNTPEATPKTFCGIWHQSYHDPYTCAYDDPRFEWKIELPTKVKVQRNHPIGFNSTPLTVAVLSDIHVDPFYEPFGVADCDEPVCCRKGQKENTRDNKGIDEILMLNSVFENDEDIFLNMDAVSNVINLGNLNDMIRETSEKKSTPAGYWGDYRNCDTPIWAFVDVIKQIASIKELDAVYYIGDNIDHHIWETTYELNEGINNLNIDTMKNNFRKEILVVPTIGNHESQPLNLFAPSSVQNAGLNTTWLYRSLAMKWSHYLSRKASKSMKQRGGFSMLIRPGLRVISINNNVAYKYNWWLIFDPLNPKRYLEWLVEELFKAERMGEKVHILSHVPPGDQDLIYTWTREFHKIVERFSSIITAQFNGHLHSDEFKIFYKDNEAFNVAWSAGSATTYQNFNLNYKIVTFDYVNFEPTSINNYIYNLTEANLAPNVPPRWFKLYDMKESFQLNDLTATSMDKLVNTMVTQKKQQLDQYVTFASKQSDAIPYCDTYCKLEMLCNAVTSVLWDRRKCDELKKLYRS
ncbi:sphingomyelin phosphodiesterase 1-like [Pararge aegeria]|uniref:sphingomyelin phosphodiesterase 1-like n=1 Tax=Pararge aegeria TaxID=116150 RepID=UPI0019CFEAB0|nr:sphingomyelin phosphodiesterase 1-like [Pararge aegeria]